VTPTMIFCWHVWHRGGGNTTPPPEDRDVTCPARPVKRKRSDRARRWTFTLNNYDGHKLHSVLDFCRVKCSAYIVGEEEGSTKHLQGYVEFKSPMEFDVLRKNLFDAHIEKARGDRAANIKYCSKEGKVHSSDNCKPLDPVKFINPTYPWQLELLHMLSREADDRTIVWIYEALGGTGKSAFCKYLGGKKGGVPLSNKACDMKHQICKMMENGGRPPELITIDIPRSVDLQYLSYTGIEEVKNGYFFSPKYEGGVCMFNPPHIFIFSNELPNRDKLSKDRWCVYEITSLNTLIRLP